MFDWRASSEIRSHEYRNGVKMGMRSGSANLTPKEHVLARQWTFYYLHRDVNVRPQGPNGTTTIAGLTPTVQPVTSEQDYEKQLHRLVTVGTVEEFWQVYMSLRRPSEMLPISELHLFRTGIRPVWEDPSNLNGGKWIMRLKKGIASRIWEDVLMALIGEQLNAQNGIINGVVLSVKPLEDVLSIWTGGDASSSSGIEQRELIRQALLQILAQYPEPHMEFRLHQDRIRRVTDLKETVDSQ